MYLNGIADDVNAYPHGLTYGRSGTRLHTSWCWRDDPNASTNHGLLYAYSDDHGRTWKNDAGATIATTGSTGIRINSAGIEVWDIGQNRGLINQEHMAVDALGRVHVLLSHMPDDEADDADFTSARTKSEYFHYYRDTSGTWHRQALGVPSVLNFRGKLAISSSNNLYAVLPDLLIAGASASSDYPDWSVLRNDEDDRFFSDPLIDSSRLLTQDKLTVLYTEKSPGSGLSIPIQSLDYTLR